MPQIINAAGLRPCGVENQMSPADGPKAIPIPLDFSVTAATHQNGVPDYTLDYSSQQANAKFSVLQSIYVDNGLNGSSLTVTCNGTGQRVTCPANSQGYFMVLCQSPIKLDFESAGNVQASVEMLNFPTAVAVWRV